MAFMRKRLLAWISVFLVGPVFALSELSPDVPAVSVAVNEFCFALCRQVARGHENAVLSPLSLTAALMMAYVGADGDTAREIQDAMYLGISRDAALVAMGQLVDASQKILSRDGVQWKSAGRIWIQKDFPVLESYDRKVREALGASIGACDFQHKSEEARAEINVWVRQATSGFISELLGPSAVSPMTRMALINACYFKGPWAAAFPKHKTRDDFFFVTPDTRVPVAMMVRDGRYAYLRTARTDILRVPYRGFRVSMIVLLPRDQNGLRELEQTLTADQLVLWIGQLEERLVHVELPRFEVEAQFDLAETLSAMGMKTAFSDAADFSGISGAQGLKIGAVVHRARIRVDEEGAEAAGASGVMMQLTAARPSGQTPVFRADHPFMFVILDETTQTILFAGRVTRP